MGVQIGLGAFEGAYACECYAFGGVLRDIYLALAVSAAFADGADVVGERLRGVASEGEPACDTLFSKHIAMLAYDPHNPQVQSCIVQSRFVRTCRTNPFFTVCAAAYAACEYTCPP